MKKLLIALAILCSMSAQASQINSLNGFIDKYIETDLYLMSVNHDAPSSFKLNVDGLVKIYRNYETNEVAANQRYVGIPTLIDARAVSISDYGKNAGILVLSGYDKDILLLTPPTPQVAALKPGEPISMVCIGQGSQFGTIIFSECTPSNEYYAQIMRNAEDGSTIGGEQNNAYLSLVWGLGKNKLKNCNVPSMADSDDVCNKILLSLNDLIYETPEKIPSNLMQLYNKFISASQAYDKEYGGHTTPDNIRKS